MTELLCGTSSWSEKSWDGSFYPAGTAPADQLAHYATVFPTVEADVTYYRIPDRRMVSGWERKTPERFVLSAKFPRSIVHGGAKEAPDRDRVLVPEAVGEDTKAFLDAMSLLGKKCGPLVLQFPYFNKSAFDGPSEFLDRLDAFLGTLPNDFRYGVEVRNRAWLGPPLLDCLRKHRAALVLVDIVYMPHPDEIAGAMDLVTTDFAYARLIGDRKAVEEKSSTFDRIVIDQSARLRRWATVLKRFLESVPATFVYANNHYAGHAPATIEELKRMIFGDGDAV